jgi:hypothetical protein
MDLYKKVEKLIRDHMIKHQSEVRRCKELLSKLDVARCNEPTQDYSFDLTSTNDNDQSYARKSIYWYDYDRNDLNRPNPFPDYTELPDK